MTKVRVLGGLVLLAVLLAAGAVWVQSASLSGPPEALCDGTPPPEVAELCGLQTAIDRTRAGDVEGARAQCDAIGSVTWKSECYFQVAEALADGGELDRALAVCADAGEFVLRCRGHALWILTEVLVDAAPADTSAQDRVDTFVRGLRAAPPSAAVDLRAEVTLRDTEDIARSAAWHGIYAGSGSADPAAARAARVGDARYAVHAFAWEATRLLGDTLGTAASVERVAAIWRGEVPPVTGPPQKQACWATRVMPRTEPEAPLWLPSVRTYPGNASFYEEDAETNILIATLDAAWTHGRVHSPDALVALQASPSVPVQKTVARQLALIADTAPEAGQVYAKEGGGDSDLRKIYEKTRKAVQRGSSGRSVVSNRLGTCE